MDKQKEHYSQWLVFFFASDLHYKQAQQYKETWPRPTLERELKVYYFLAKNI
jgi:hypothetical protein